MSELEKVTAVDTTYDASEIQVLDELDPKRQEYVLNRITGGQVFITCCENDRLDRLVGGRVFHIRNGEVL